MKTTRFLEAFSAPQFISCDTEVVLVFLLQCDFTLLDERRRVVPRTYVDIPDLLRAIQRIATRIGGQAPMALFMWSIPIVPILVNDASMSTDMARMAAGLRFLMVEMRDRKHIVFELARCYMTGEHRITHIRRYVPDGVHPA